MWIDVVPEVVPAEKIVVVHHLDHRPIAQL
jgi:hypothetical protein